MNAIIKRIEFGSLERTTDPLMPFRMVGLTYHRMRALPDKHTVLLGGDNHHLKIALIRDVCAIALLVENIRRLNPLAPAATAETRITSPDAVLELCR